MATIETSQYDNGRELYDLLYRMEGKEAVVTDVDGDRMTGRLYRVKWRSEQTLEFGEINRGTLTIPLAAIVHVQLL